MGGSWKRNLPQSSSARPIFSTIEYSITHMNEQNLENQLVETTSGSAGLEVAGEPGVYWCARHKKTQTRLRCGRCEAPICPKCTVYGPTGARCRSCVSYRGSHLYQVKAPQLLAAFALSALLGIVGTFLIHSTGILLLLFFAPALGGGLGKIITQITRGKRGPVIAGAASLGIAVGSLGVIAPKWFALSHSARMMHLSTLDLAMRLGSGELYVLIFLVLAIVGVWAWLK